MHQVTIKRQTLHTNISQLQCSQLQALLNGPVCPSLISLQHTLNLTAIPLYCYCLIFCIDRCLLLASSPCHISHCISCSVHSELAHGQFPETVTWKPKVKTFQIIVKVIPNNIKSPYSYDGLHVIHMSELKKKVHLLI